MKKIVIAGGSGFLGNCLVGHYSKTGDQVVILTRAEASQTANAKYVHWDGKTIGPWTETLENCDVLINLNGKSVDCRYTDNNKALIYSTRLESTAVLGQAIQHAVNPPKLWINSSSATIYRHSLDKAMDEYTGEIGTGFSVDVCQKWEQVFNSFVLPATRKVIIRTSIVLGKKEGALKPLKTLAKLGMGGSQGPSNQYFSWLHEDDFVSIIDFITNTSTMQGVYNLAAPNPVPNRQVMKAIRHAVGAPFGLPMPTWLLTFGAILISTETELILKSRRVVPKKLLEAGYKFKFETIENAVSSLLVS